MDSHKIGLYIAACRRRKRLTQQQLADRLGVTNKAVSKWETGAGIPDIGILEDLSAVLGVSIDAILKAETPETDVSGTPEEALFQIETPLQKQGVRRRSALENRHFRRRRRAVCWAAAVLCWLAAALLFAVLWSREEPGGAVTAALCLFAAGWAARGALTLYGRREADRHYERLAERYGLPSRTVCSFYETGLCETTGDGERRVPELSVRAVLYAGVSLVLDTADGRICLDLSGCSAGTERALVAFLESHCSGARTVRETCRSRRLSAARMICTLFGGALVLLQILYLSGRWWYAARFLHSGVIEYVGDGWFVLFWILAALRELVLTTRCTANTTTPARRACGCLAAGT